MKLANAISFLRYTRKQTNARKCRKNYERANLTHFDLSDRIEHSADTVHPILFTCSTKYNAKTGSVVLNCFLSYYQNSGKSYRVYPGKLRKKPSDIPLLSKIEQADKTTNTILSIPTLARGEV